MSDDTAARHASWRRLPANVRSAGRAVRRAAPREYATTLVISVVSGMALLALLLSGRELIRLLAPDSGSRSLDLGTLVPVLVILTLATAVTALGSVVQTEQRWLLGYLVEQDATGSIVDAVAAVSLAEFETPEFQDHLQRSLRQAVHRSWEITQAVAQLAAAVVGAGVITLVLLTVQPLLVPALLLAGLPMAYAATRNNQSLYQAMHAITPINRERQYVQDVLTGRDEAKEVRAFTAVPYLRGRYDVLYRREIDALRRITALRMRRGLLAGAAATVITVATLVVLVVLTVNGAVSLADAAVGAVAVQQLASRVRLVNGALAQIQEATLFLEDYADFLARAASATSPPPAGTAKASPTATTTTAAVELSDVWFTYPGAVTPALCGVSLTVESGELVALVGANGSGKTTVAKLACGLYEPSAGHLGWGLGDAVRVGVSFQDFMRFQLTAHDNIALGDADRIDDRERVRASGRGAGIDAYLEQLPDGYETWLSPSFEGGTDLSVGQWQRVAMARALFRDAPLLVLDEPTAALDPAAERALIDSTRALFRDKAVLVISHRFANVVGADRIDVLDAGRIIESGPHDALMDLDGRYAELYRLQASTFGQRSP